MDSVGNCEFLASDQIVGRADLRGIIVQRLAARLGSNSENARNVAGVSRFSRVFESNSTGESSVAVGFT
jgi:hypothetical protein